MCCNKIDIKPQYTVKTITKCVQRRSDGGINEDEQVIGLVIEVARVVTRGV